MGGTRARVETLLRMADRPWAVQTLGHVIALLRVSEALAERARVPRYARTASRPGEKIAVGASAVRESSGHVAFSDEELVAIGVEPGVLNPFVIQGEHADLLVGQSLGHSVLERRPLVRFRLERKSRLRTGESGRVIWRSLGALVRVRGGILTCSYRWSAATARQMSERQLRYQHPNRRFLRERRHFSPEARAAAPWRRAER